MLKRKLDVDLICEITKLTREEINNISKEKQYIKNPDNYIWAFYV